MNFSNCNGPSLTLVSFLSKRSFVSGPYINHLGPGTKEIYSFGPYFSHLEPGHILAIARDFV